MSEITLCIPGPWMDRSDFLRSVITHAPVGQFMFAGGILADVQAKDHVMATVVDHDPALRRAFDLAGQRQLDEATLAAVAAHQSVAFLFLEGDVRALRPQLIKYSELLRDLGGTAVKIDSCGVAHTWARWLELLGSGQDWDLYCAAVVLVGDDDHYYSCGMHHFGLAECAVPRTLDPADAADLMNRFNMWRIAEDPVFESGHTFSLDADAPRWRLALTEDTRHAADEGFYNPEGVWVLSAV